MRMRQLKRFVVCQMCGVGASRDTAVSDGWLVSPRRSDPSVTVVRCPRHLSEWALRQSQAGRTRFWRQKLREGQDWTPPPYKMAVEPIPWSDDQV